MAKVLIQARVPEDLHARLESYRQENGGITPTEAYCQLLERGLQSRAALCADCSLTAERDLALKSVEDNQRLLGLAIAELDKLKAKPVRLPPTPKKKATWNPLSQHTKARMAVLNYVESRYPLVGATSSEVAKGTGQMTGNAAKRLRELADEGYICSSGEYRQSLDSGKMLTVWITAKEYKGV